jgi:O-antigen/teichoic acid export membrane protein
MKKLLAFALPQRFRSTDVFGILVRGAGIALLIQIAGNGIGYAVQILLARWLGASSYGVFTYLITWAQVFSIVAILGLDLGVVRFVPEYLVQQDWNRLRGILRWSRQTVLAAGIILAGTSGVILFLLRPIQSAAVTLVLGSLLIPLFAVSEIQTEIIRSTKRIAWAYTPPILLQPILLLGMAFVFLRIFGVLTDYDAVAAFLISLCLVTIFQAGVVRRIFSGWTRNVAAAYNSKEWLRVSLPILMNAVFSIILLKVDTLMVGYFLGSEEVGIYGAAVKTAMMVGITLQAANTIVAPMIASYYARRDMAGLQEVVSLATLGSFGASLVIGLGVVLFSGPILGAFGAEFVRARMPMLLLILGQLVNVGSGSVGMLMVLTGHERQSMVILGLCALIISGLCLAVIPVFGIIGAAVVSMLGISLWNIWIYRLVVQYLGIRPSVFFAVKQFFAGKD